MIEKSVNNAFIGTSLERELRDLGVNEIVITGVITNNSVEVTARMSGNLGFRTIVVSDATATFGRRDYNGVWRGAAPTPEDQAFVGSLMQPVLQPGKVASWIAPPDRGINNLPAEYEYVRVV